MPWDYSRTCQSTGLTTPSPTATLSARPTQSPFTRTPSLGPPTHTSTGPGHSKAPPSLSSCAAPRTTTSPSPEYGSSFITRQPGLSPRPPDWHRYPPLSYKSYGRLPGIATRVARLSPRSPDSLPSPQPRDRVQSPRAASSPSSQGFGPGHQTGTAPFPMYSPVLPQYSTSPMDGSQASPPGSEGHCSLHQTAYLVPIQ
jgi:hypothetical protein